MRWGSGCRRPRADLLEATAIVLENANSYQLPSENPVLLLFNPFGSNVMSRVLERIEASWRAQPRHLVIVYHNPKQRDVFDRQSFLNLTMEVDNVFPWLVYETTSEV